MDRDYNLEEKVKEILYKTQNTMSEKIILITELIRKERCK